MRHATIEPARNGVQKAHLPGDLVGPVAQWLEQATHNRSVAGSIPARPTALNGDYLVCCGWRLAESTIGFRPGRPLEPDLMAICLRQASSQFLESAERTWGSSASAVNRGTVVVGAVVVAKGWPESLLLRATVDNSNPTTIAEYRTPRRMSSRLGRGAHHHARAHVRQGTKARTCARRPTGSGCAPCRRRR